MVKIYSLARLGLVTTETVNVTMDEGRYLGLDDFPGTSFGGSSGGDALRFDPVSDAREKRPLAAPRCDLDRALGPLVAAVDIDARIDAPAIDAATRERLCAFGYDR